MHRLQFLNFVQYSSNRESTSLCSQHLLHVTFESTHVSSRYTIKFRSSFLNFSNCVRYFARFSITFGVSMSTCFLDLHFLLRKPFVGNIFRKILFPTFFHPNYPPGFFFGRLFVQNESIFLRLSGAVGTRPATVHFNFVVFFIFFSDIIQYEYNEIYNWRQP